MLPFEKRNKEVMVRSEEETNPEYGCNPEERDNIDLGMIILNKPAGPTSHQVSDYVKRILDLKKAGHSGTLDPNVTGVLPIALGRSTKVIQGLLNAGKEYICLMRLHDEFPAKVIRKKMDELVGEIKQIPPIKSAVKRVKRTRSIYYLEILEIKGKEVLFKVGCQAGTYIRKLCHDFGKSLNSGAHMQELVRTKAGPFSDKDWVILHDLKDAKEEGKLKEMILPVERAVDHLPKIWIKDNAVDTICHGAQLSLPAVAKFEFEINIGDIVAIMTLKDELICLAKAKSTGVNMKMNNKGIVAGNTKVFMERGTYPKYEKN
ncbi:RNA-guided pseudouridylation complex pseudouridine synthase subunit Cbf5 [archaeon]|nr:RNA-guided pseudouridylation complex pseudouridine synthase subunit Cbf5 [archaeon]MBT4397520.1 RNA-guided pseudouridylation complex pseudouridine synthase subunit Cbf5 [archaeon]MBT4440848.1 RNA-guided pseudouridylation complex pseudouridine synthase subunit Cbf5 [archaeon]